MSKIDDISNQIARVSSEIARVKDENKRLKNQLAAIGAGEIPALSESETAQIQQGLDNLASQLELAPMVPANDNGINFRTT